MTEPSCFHISRLCRPTRFDEADEDSIRLSAKLRELRLKALKFAPDAFASTYEIEKERSLEETLQRLRNPRASHFVATRSSEFTFPTQETGQNDQHVFEAEWVGMLVLLGPEEDKNDTVSADTDPFNRMTSAQREHKIMMTPTSEPASSVPKNLHYHLNGMFVDPTARGNGLGALLIAAALREVERQAKALSVRARVTISVYGHNNAARRSYEKAGFKVVLERTSNTHRERVVVDMQMLLLTARTVS